MTTGVSATSQAPLPSPQQGIERYYRLHSLIYDATRWSFLFGRKSILDRVATLSQPSRILEIGCGTGTNLVRFASRFSHASLTGLDLSEAMLARARNKTARHADRIQLVRQCYDRPLGTGSSFDLVLFSYALSMFNPGWEAAITSALHDLAPGGIIAVVDFHDTPLPAFARWMGVNHVRMEGHLLPHLTSTTEPLFESVEKAYGGVWRYFLYVGKKREFPATGIIRG